MAWPVVLPIAGCAKPIAEKGKCLNESSTAVALDHASKKKDNDRKTRQVHCIDRRC